MKKDLLSWSNDKVPIIKDDSTDNGIEALRAFIEYITLAYGLLLVTVGMSSSLWSALH